MEKVLVTGSSGFIGGFLVEEGLNRGMQVWAGVRRSSSRKYLKQAGLQFAELNFSDVGLLTEQLRRHKEEHAGWDYIIHCAGVTKCKDKRDFMRGNYEATKHFVEALTALDMVPKKFIYLSSLSIFGPVRDDDYMPIGDNDRPMPNTEYGRSKVRSEEFLQGLPTFPFVIFRPTGVYGPRERDYFLMVKSIAQHVDFTVGSQRQDLTFVYVKDLVKAVYLGVEKAPLRRAYFVSDGQTYDSRRFSDLIREELGHPMMVRITCPLWLLRIVTLCGEWWARLTGRVTALNNDKYNILKQRNWRCDIRPLVEELGYQPDYLLERGVKETVAWYKQEKWI
ncbi:MAG: NAD(P)-dependent oxidoreductase [Bacteroidales bacterium]|nr:NAD(P)-dependent oxidoreductase [Bacteroidales bacterium]